MAITISGENNNDRILAQDGVIDSISGFNIAGIITASSFTGDLTGDVTGNLTGNVTGNINNTTLLLQTGGSERVRIDSNGKVGVGVNPSAYPGKFVVSGDALICDRDIHSRVANSVANSDRGFKQDTDGVEKLHLYADNSSHIILEGNNGVEKLRIQSNGKVGIGTDFVDGNLTVHTDTPGEVVFNIHADLGTNNNRTFNLYAPATDSSSDPYIFQTGNSMQFNIDTTKAFKIHSNGYIGIGTNTPSELFDVHSNDSAILRLYTKNVSSNASLHLRGGNNGNSKIVFGDTADHDIGEIRYNHYNNNNYMSFHTNTGERLRIDSNGRVLIGHDTTPVAAASVAIVGSYGASSYLTPFVYLCRDEDATSIGTNESLGQINFASRDGYRGAVIEAKAAGAWSGSSSDGYLVFKTTPDNSTVPVVRFSIASDGKATFNEGLNVTNAVPSITLTDSANSQYAFIDGNSGNLVLHSDKGNTGSSTTLKLAVDNNVKMYMDDGGRTLFRTNGSQTSAITDDNIPLQIAESSASMCYFSANKGSSYGALFGYHTAYGGTVIRNVNSDDIVFYTNNTSQKLRLTSAGHLQITTGNLEFANGSGIDFSNVTASGNTVSTDGNKLDDYEEGYYNPTLTPGSGGSVTSTTSVTLRYVKVGRLVHIVGRLHFATNQNNLSSFTISLPYANSTTNKHDTSVCTHVIRGNGGDPVQGIRIFRIGPGSTTMFMNNHEGAQYGDLGTTSPHINVNFSYFAA